jgi:hypothetical protein
MTPLAGGRAAGAGGSLPPRQARGGLRTPSLTAAILCFPASWTLAEKLGRPLGAIHGPVAGYDPGMAAPRAAHVRRDAPGAAALAAERAALCRPRAVPAPPRGRPARRGPRHGPTCGRNGNACCVCRVPGRCCSRSTPTCCPSTALSGTQRGGACGGSHRPRGPWALGQGHEPSKTGQYEAYPYPERDPADEAKRLIVGSPSHPLENRPLPLRRAARLVEAVPRAGGRRRHGRRADPAGAGAGECRAGRRRSSTISTCPPRRARSPRRGRRRAGSPASTFHTGSLLDAAELGNSTTSTVAACCTTSPTRRQASTRWRAALAPGQRDRPDGLRPARALRRLSAAIGLRRGS